MTRHPLYEVRVYEMAVQLDDDGTSATALDVASFATYAMTPQDAILAWASRIEEENAS